MGKGSQSLAHQGANPRIQPVLGKTRLDTLGEGLSGMGNAIDAIFPGKDLNTIPLPDEDAEDENSLAWTTKVRHTEPLDPPFEINSVLPSAKAPQTEENKKLSVDDLISEIDSL